MTVERRRLAERLRGIPGMGELLPALQGIPRVYLVGGAVRDVLLGARSVDLDVVVEGDATAVARDVAERLEGDVIVHERFGTATVRAGRLAVDMATARRERYTRPGALPEVEPAPLDDDLGRRDFTVNAMALGLEGDQLGRLHDPHGGCDDLEARAVRILHDESFVDDPTRLLRAVRYESRLGFRMDPETERRARDAIAADALELVSGPRVRDELMDLLAEVEVGRALERTGELGLDRALHPALVVDAELAASAALGALETGADRALAALAALVGHDPIALSEWVESLGLRREARDRALRAAQQAPKLLPALRAVDAPSAIHALLRCEPPETLALALALGAPPRPILDFVGTLATTRLEISGQDLVDAGVPRSPAIGRALEEVLRRKLAGQVAGRAEALRRALELAREEGAPPGGPGR